jgi:hypothetical protein
MFTLAARRPGLVAKILSPMIPENVQTSRNAKPKHEQLDEYV